LLEEYTTSDDSSSDETDSCGSDDLTVGEVNFAESSKNESDNVHFATGCSARGDSKGVFAWEDMGNYVGQRKQFIDNYGPQNEAQNETHCAKEFKMFFDDELIDLILRETNTYAAQKNKSQEFHFIAFQIAGLDTCHYG